MKMWTKVRIHEGKLRTVFPFGSVRMDVTVGRFPQMNSFLFRPKVNFQAERFTLLTTRLVPSKRIKCMPQGLKA
uniref:Uncharacterized protein n=1 Tax=Romanomermis culicivorax TaxID=13658 RepID=A0A915KD31_ROMCU